MHKKNTFILKIIRKSSEYCKKNFFLFQIFLLFISSTAISASARAEEKSEDTDEHRITVTAPVEDNSSETFSSSLVSTRLSVKDQESVSVDPGSVLKKAAGLSLRRTGSPGSPITAAIRGSSADQIVVRLADLPLTPPGGGPVDLSSLPPSLLESIVVSRGTDASFGAGALGGVLHLEPLSADFSKYPGEKEISCPSGENDQNQAQCLRSSGEHPRRTVMLRGDSLGSGGSAVAWRGRSNNSRIAAAVDLQASRGKYTFERQYTPNLPDAPWFEEERTNNALKSGSAILSTEGPASGGKLRLTMFGHRSHREVAGMTGFPTPDADSITTRSLVGGSFISDWSGSGLFRSHFAAWLGSDGYSYNPGPNPSPAAGTEFENTRRVFGIRSSMDIISGYLVSRLSAEASMEALSGSSIGASRPSGSLGISTTAYLAQDLLSINAALKAESFGGQSLSLSPRAGTGIYLPASLVLFFNAGRGVRIPALFELHGETAMITNNELLKPESAITYDAGLEQREASFFWRLTGWKSNYRDLIAYELYPPMRLRPLNIGEAMIRGIEAEGAVSIAGSIGLSGAYTLTDSINYSSAPNAHGLPLPYRPRHRAYGKIEINTGPFSAFTDIEAQSRAPRNRANTRWNPERLLWGGGLNLKTENGILCGIKISNLLNYRHLEDLYGYPLPGRTFYFYMGYDK